MPKFPCDSQDKNNVPPLRDLAEPERELLRLRIKKSRFTCRYPNFEAETHWPMLIDFIGPVSFMNTALFERMHQQFKAGIPHTNRKCLVKDLLVDAAEEIAIRLSPFGEENALPSATRKHRGDMQLYGKPTTVAWNAEIAMQLYDAMQTLGIELFHSPEFYQRFSGFYLGGHRIQPGSYIRFSARIALLMEYEDVWAISSPELADNPPDDGRVSIIAGVAAVANFDLRSSTAELPQVWFKLDLLYEDASTDILDCQCFTRGPSVWLPAGDLGVKALELVHVVPHPNYTELMVHNRWLRRSIKCFDFKE